ncbi:MAG: META domain-containing protein [Muribaculaceae bacterium]|nr:META domain-containing protein [Muribaculaceae bacterium]
MKKYLIIIAATLACVISWVACAPNKNNQLTGKWRLETYADPFKAILEPTTVEDGEIYTLQLDDNGVFSFTTDCNTVSGEYAVSGSRIHFLNLCATEMACESEIVERSVKCQLPGVESYRLSEDSTLCLLGSQGNVLFKLAKANKTAHSTESGDECPFPYSSAADAEPKFVLKIASDSLLACYNNVEAKDEDPLIMDTTNPGFAEFMAQWINSLDSVQAQELFATSALHITVGQEVSDATVEKVKTTLRGCGVEKFSISNFDIER